MARNPNHNHYAQSSEFTRKQLLNRLVQHTYRDVKQALADGASPEIAAQIVAKNTPRFVRYGGLK